jgi:hypothetical protein
LKCGSDKAGGPGDNGLSVGNFAYKGKVGLAESQGPIGRLQKQLCLERLTCRLGLHELLHVPAVQIKQASVFERALFAGGMQPVRKRRLLRNVAGGNEQSCKVHQSSFLFLNFRSGIFFIYLKIKMLLIDFLFVSKLMGFA